MTYSKGDRVRLTVDYSGAEAGTLGTVTWTHPHPVYPVRVQWDGHDPKPGDLIWGMDDIGWLMAEEEIEPA